MTRLIPRRSSKLFLFATLLLSLLLTACSSPTATVSTPPTTAPTPTPTATPTPTPTPAPPQGGGKNLIVNGDAESGPGTMDGSMPVTNIPGWTNLTGNFDVVAYGASGGYPTDTDPGAPNHGKNFFAGGPNDDVSTATQLINVAQMAALLDTGNVTYVLSGWLGGYADQDDNAVLAIAFEDANGKQLGQAVQIGPVMAADRNDMTGFAQRTARGTVPKGTRRISVQLTMTRVSGSANDGYADNLSLTLQG